MSDSENYQRLLRQLAGIIQAWQDDAVAETVALNAIAAFVAEAPTPEEWNND